MVVCSKCGQKIPEKDDFCPKCGEQQLELDIDCPKCGQKIPEYDEYCPKCGHQQTGHLSRSGLTEIPYDYSKHPRVKKFMVIFLVGFFVLIVLSVSVITNTPSVNVTLSPETTDAPHTSIICHTFENKEVCATVNVTPVEPTTIAVQRTEEMPQSCDGINAVRDDLYPNLDECLDAIVERINFACYAKSNGDEYETIACVSDLASSLNEQCQDSEDMGLLSVSYESCLWNQYSNVYKKLGDVCWKDEGMMKCLADVKIP